MVADIPCVALEEMDIQFGCTEEALETFPTRQRLTKWILNKKKKNGRRHPGQTVIEDLKV